MGDFILLVIVVGGLGLVLFLYFKYFKLLKLKSIVFIDGSLGTGKSFLSVALAVRLYKRALRRYKIARKVLGLIAPLSKKLQERYDLLEEPVLYSNIRLRNVPFTKLTKDLLYRQNFRFAFKSVILIDEASLMADQFCYKDREMSERLSNFFKLMRHELHGGYCIVNSQSTSDLHYSLKYVLSDYLYIHHMNKWPLFCTLKVQEMAFSADKDGGNVVNAHQGDIEESLRTMFVLKKYFRYYDSYCYSIFTDCLPRYRKTLRFGQHDSLKDAYIVSFKEYKYLTENIEKMRKEKGSDVDAPTQA